MEVELSKGLDAISRELKRPLLELRQLALGFDGNGLEDEKIRAEMVNVTERAMRQVDDLAKIREFGSNKFSLEPVAVRAVCDDVIRELTQMFCMGTGEMRVVYSNRSRLVRANTDLLKSVVYNFLLDATHYARDELKAELKVREVKKKVEIEVRDYGPALPMEIWREMKETLVRPPSDIVMRPGTSVVGLYIASKFSKYMDAEVGAVRHQDGTSFFVRLPIVQQTSILEELGR
ncbi:MAG: hypothetical protein Q4B87_00825 [Candidatus Saccharibacteria bacterium]|nr:hypothetical protein [Candidatus Saccharibacteria bacterium]